MSSPLLPPERMALLLATEQIKRRENPSPNITAVLIMALARLVDKLGDESLYVRCPAGCDLGERDDGNTRWDCDPCVGMGFVQAWPEEDNDEG